VGAASSRLIGPSNRALFIYPPEDLSVANSQIALQTLLKELALL